MLAKIFKASIGEIKVVLEKETFVAFSWWTTCKLGIHEALENDLTIKA